MNITTYGGFQPGKNFKMLLSLHGKKGTALVKDKARAEQLYKQAQEAGLDINYPLTFKDLEEHRRNQEAK